MMPSSHVAGELNRLVRQTVFAGPSMVNLEQAADHEFFIEPIFLAEPRAALREARGRRQFACFIRAGAVLNQKPRNMISRVWQYAIVACAAQDRAMVAF